ncbi:DUF3558 family protein [Streptomyces sp. NPDC059101]|uniref:DUF3558 family protein n=1 Tax=Streptomyces sp. NPDC059101 TaxID=3346728 RepID=UPI0036A6B366
MAQWNDDRQDWVEPSRPVSALPDGRSRRMLIVTVTVLVLVAAAVVGLWRLARDDSQDSPGWSGLPSSAPSVSWSGTPGEPGSSSGPGAVGTAADPCSALDPNTAAALGLSAGRADVSANPQSGLKACSWSWTSGGVSLTYDLIYSKDIPVSPEPTPTSIANVPSASVTGNDLGCVVLWPTSFGKAFVHVKSDSGAQPDLCNTAAGFASQVAPRVPS